jgi:hypothetical protein
MELAVEQSVYKKSFHMFDASGKEQWANEVEFEFEK